MKRALLLIIAASACGVSSEAAARTYMPLNSSAVAAPATAIGYRPIKSSARPYLPGFRPPEVEVLLDALARKRPKTIGTSFDKAGKLIIRNALVDSKVRARLRGIYAEALYLKLNPQYGYVAKSNAPQNDVYALKTDRRPPLNAQIKTHTRPDPAAYARAMLKDHSSHLFLIPDDHVQPLRRFLTAEIQDLESKGMVEEAARVARRINRIQGLGFTSSDLDDSLHRVVRAVSSEQNAPYVALGVGIGMAVAPDLWGYMRTGAWSDRATLRVARGLSMVAAERAATFGIKSAGGGHLLGRLKGNAMVAGGILIADTAFSIYEYGGTAAFRDSRLYTHFGGTVGGMALGFAVGTPVAVGATTLIALTPWAPAAPVIGPIVGFLAGSAASAIGYVGGESATKWMLEKINPAFLHDMENAKIALARELMDAQIRHLRDGP